MTEPDHGSDLANIQASAVDMGDYFLVNGTKTFISNGMVADLLGKKKEGSEHDQSE